MYYDCDHSLVQVVARGLQRIQHIFGIIPNVKSKGEVSKNVIQKLLEMQREEQIMQAQHATTNPLRLHAEIDTLIIMDRDVDLISPFLTPLTYEGLIDSFIGIKEGAIHMDPSVVGEDDDVEEGKKKKKAADGRKPGDPVTITMTNNDVIFAEIRSLSIEQLGVFLKDKAIKIKVRKLPSATLSNEYLPKTGYLQYINDF